MAAQATLAGLVGVRIPAPQLVIPSEHEPMFVSMGRGVRFTEEEARRAVASSLSYSEALRRLGLRSAGGNHATLRKYVALWDISVAHFDPYASQRQGGLRVTQARPLREI